MVSAYGLQVLTIFGGVYTKACLEPSPTCICKTLPRCCKQMHCHIFTNRKGFKQPQTIQHSNMFFSLGIQFVRSLRDQSNHTRKNINNFPDRASVIIIGYLSIFIYFIVHVFCYCLCVKVSIKITINFKPLCLFVFEVMSGGQ